MAQPVEPEPSPLDPSHFARVFEPPLWLRDLGFMSWFLVGLLALLVGLIWILGLTSTIVEPVTVGAVVAIVAAPLVGRLERHRVPRPAGAAIVLLGLIGVIVLVVALVIGGIADQATQIKGTLTHSVDTIEQWFNDAGANDTADNEERRRERREHVGQHAAGRARERHPQPHVARLLPHVHVLQRVLPPEGRPFGQALGRPATWAFR